MTANPGGASFVNRQVAGAFHYLRRIAMSETNGTTDGAPAPESPAPENAPGTGTRPSPTGSAARRTAPVKKMSRKEKQVRLLLIMGTPVLCLILLALILAKFFGEQEVKKIKLDAAQLWEKNLDEARKGQTKIQECYFTLRQGNGVIPPEKQAKYDAGLAEGRKILETSLAELEKLRKDAGEGVMTYDRDLYPIRKNLMLAKRLADETDRKRTIEFPKQYKVVLDAIKKVQDEYKAAQEQMTPEKKEAIVKGADAACKQAQELAEQWGEMLDKYAVQNKTSQRNDPEEDAINKLSAGIMTTRKILKSLK